MGHRALVAYRRADGSIRLHRAHRGVALDRRIGPDAPFGGPDPAAPGRTVVDPDPFSRRADPADVLAAVDRSIESLVLVSPAREATTVLVCHVGFPVLDDGATGRDDETTDRDDGATGRDDETTDRDDGATGRDDETTDRDPLPSLRFVVPRGDPAAVRAWFVALRSRLSTAVGRDALAPATARAVLEAAVAARGAVHGPDDPSFIRTA